MDKPIPCDTFDCDNVANWRADWPENGGFYCDDCIEPLRRSGDNVIRLASLR